MGFNPRFEKKPTFVWLCEYLYASIRKLMNEANEIKSSISPIPNITTVFGELSLISYSSSSHFSFPFYGGHQYFTQLPPNRGKDRPPPIHHTNLNCRIPRSHADMDMSPPRLQFTEPVIRHCLKHAPLALGPTTDTEIHLRRTEHAETTLAWKIASWEKG